MSALANLRGCALRACLVLLTLAAGIGLASQAHVSAAPEGGGPERADDAHRASLPLPALEDALVRNLNRGDEDGVVALFDPQATVEADRHAAGVDEIRLWARRQIAYSINIVVDRREAADSGPNRAMWTAHVWRQDWRAIGLPSVVMTQAIWTVGPRIVHFSAFPTDGTLVPQLGDAWRPSSAPDPWLLKQSSDEPGGPNSYVPPSSAPVFAALAALLGTLVLGTAARARSMSVRRVPPRALIAQLDAWQHGARHES
jgi:hypothetical protein